MWRLYIFILLIVLTSCEPLPKVKISGDNPPTFILSGRTDTLGFSICCKNGTVQNSYEDNIWEIRNNHDPEVNVPITVVYGITPRGFRQVRPKDNAASVPLIDGRKYSYWAQGMYGAKVGCFKIQGGKAVDVECDRDNEKGKYDK